MHSGVAVGVVTEPHADSKCELSHFVREQEKVQEPSLHYQERITEIHTIISELNEKIGFLQCTTISEDDEFSELSSELSHSQQEANEDEHNVDQDPDQVSFFSLPKNQSIPATADMDNCSDLNLELQRVLRGLESVVCGHKKIVYNLSVADVDRHIEQLAADSQHSEFAIKKSGKENKPCPGRKATAATRLVKKKSAALIKNQCPSGVKVSKQELTTLTRKLLNLEARVGWLEERLKEKAHQSRPATTDRVTSTDGFPAFMSTLLVTPTLVSDENEPFPHYSALEEKTTSASGHLDDAGVSLDFPSAASTPLVDRTFRQQTPSEHILSMDSQSSAEHSNHRLTDMLMVSCTPVRENMGFSSVSDATSFCLRLPETPTNASHYHVRRSLIQGVIQPDITLNHVPLETEQRMYMDSTGPDGKPRADRFAVHLFKRLIPLRVYQDWVGLVNFDGSRGKTALPHNVRQAISDAVAKKFHATAQDWKQIKDRINELLRKKRLSFPLF